MPAGLELAALVLLGGWAALDSAALGQFMISRPLVATILAGAVVGQPAEAAQIALVLEAVHLGVLPIGAARFPEGGPAGVVAGAATVFTAGVEGLLTVIVFALLWEWVGGLTTWHLRRLNGRFVSRAAPGAPGVETLQRWALLRDFSRGAVLVVLGLPLLWALASATSPLLAGSSEVAEGALAVAALASLAAASRMFGLARLPYAFLGAVLVGVVAWIR